MKIVIVGASGFLGGALAAALARDGDELLCTARDPDAARERAPWPQQRTRWIGADLAAAPEAGFWRPHLARGDIVINAAGILREGRPGEFEALHAQGPSRLFDACRAAGVALVVQISALGAATDARSGYHRSKAAADAHLQALPELDSAIVQPSLVWGRDGASARLFASLAVLPLLVLPGGGRQPLQPIHLDDLVAGIVALVRAPPRGARRIAFVGPQPLMLRDYLAVLRAQLGHAHRAWVLPMPERLFLRMAGLAGRWRGSLLDADAAHMLLQGNAAPAEDLGALLGRPPRPASRFITPAEAPALQRLAWLSWMAPLLRWSIALVWIWTFVVSIGLYPRQQSLELLAQVGAHGAWAELLLTGAALFDLALGIGTIALGAAARARFLWPLQLLLIGFYTAAITVAMPEFWLHPFGPLSKNLPMCAAIALLWALDAPASRRARRTRGPAPWNTSS